MSHNVAVVAKNLTFKGILIETYNFHFGYREDEMLHKEASFVDHLC